MGSLGRRSSRTLFFFPVVVFELQWNDVVSWAIHTDEFAPASPPPFFSLTRTALFLHPVTTAPTLLDSCSSLVSCERRFPSRFFNAVAFERRRQVSAFLCRTGSPSDNGGIPLGMTELRLLWQFFPTLPPQGLGLVGLS